MYEFVRTTVGWLTSQGERYSPSLVQFVGRAVGSNSFNADGNNYRIVAISVAFVLCSVTALLIVAHLCRAFCRGLYMDYYLSKLPSIRGSLPLLGHAHLLAGPAPWRKMADWSYYPNKCFGAAASTKKVSRLVVFNVAGMRVVYINEPRLLKRVLLTKQRHYPKAIDAAYKHFMCLLGTGLVTSEGEHWKAGRLLLSHALRVDILEEIPAMTMKAVDRVMRKLDEVHVGTHSYADLNEEFRHMTLQVIGETALSLTPDETDAIFPSLYLPIVHECNARVWAPWRAYMPFLRSFREQRHCLRELNRVISDIICKRWAALERHTENTVKDKKSETAKRPDILTLCMSRISRLDRKTVLQLRDDVKTMLLAGHETSAALLTWASYEVICHPEIRQRIVEEARELFSPTRCKQTVHTRYGERGVPTADDVRELIWTPAVLRETLRLHSVVPLVMRYAAQLDVWTAAETGLKEDVTIPAGCVIAVGIEGVHKNPDVWPDPDTFDPARFIDADIANNTNMLGASVERQTTVQYSKRIDPYAFIPFINGPRNCLGQHLSLMETQVALAYLFLNWDLKLYVDPAQLGEVPGWMKSVGRHHDFCIPQIPHDGLKVYGTLN